MNTKTTADRQRELRARRLSEGLAEVRGIYAKPEDHVKIKAYAKKVVSQFGRPRD